MKNADFLLKISLFLQVSFSNILGLSYLDNEMAVYIRNHKIIHSITNEDRRFPRSIKLVVNRNVFKIIKKNNKFKRTNLQNYNFDQTLSRFSIPV